MGGEALSAGTCGAELTAGGTAGGGSLLSGGPNGSHTLPDNPAWSGTGKGPCRGRLDVQRCVVRLCGRTN